MSRHSKLSKVIDCLRVSAQVGVGVMVDLLLGLLCELVIARLGFIHYRAGDVESHSVL